jgi:hypothetical protein
MVGADSTSARQMAGVTMSRALQVRSLGVGQVNQAFPLVQAVVPGVTLENWLAYTRALLGARNAGQGGVIAAHDGDGYIYGLFCHKIENDLRHGPTLAIEHMVVLDMVDRKGAIEALMVAIDKLARQRGCRFVHVALPQKVVALAETDGSFLGPLRLAGHEVDSVRLCKRVEHTSGKTS